MSEVLRNFIAPCSSDAYILVNQPGLTLNDLQNYEGFTYLRTYSFMSSTLGVMPRIEKPVDFEELEKSIIRHCDATVIYLDELEEVETYIDTQTRLIVINFPDLPDDPTERIKALSNADKALRNTIRKLPSPSHSLVYTTLDKRLIDQYEENKWKKMEIFPDIIKQDETRNYEYERNDRVNQVERPFPEKRTNFINPDKLVIPSFLDKELILKNELLVMGVILITFVLALTSTLKLLFKVVKTAIGKGQKEVSISKKNK